MPTKVFKLFNLVLMLLLFLSACGTTNPMEFVPDVDIPIVSDSQDQPVDVDTPPVADQPLFDDVIYSVVEQCQGAGLNQACHNGEVSDLSAGQTFRAESASLDSYDVWVVRLQAPGVDSDFESLLILAAGNTEMRFDEIFVGRDETNQNLPRLIFSTNDDSDFSSGLIIINESEEDLLTLEANGVGLTLGSTAVVTSQPNSEMKVNMLMGSVAVTTSETVYAAAGESISVAMTAESKPQPATGVIDEDLLTPLVPPKKDGMDELLTPLVPPKKSLQEDLLTPLWPGATYQKFEKAYNRCIAGDARQVYRVMYFAQQLLENSNPELAEQINHEFTEKDFQTFREMVKKCATFELIMVGRAQGASSLSWNTSVAGDVLKVQFDHNGNLVSPVEGSLTTEEFSPEMPLPPGCSSSTEINDSVLRVLEKSTLKIYYNTMRIRLHVWPNLMTQTIIMNCPSAPPVQIPLDWNTYFWYLHPDLLRQENQSYLIQGWEYTGGEIYAEAFYLGRSGTIEDGTVTSDTAFTLMHTPQK